MQLKAGRLGVMKAMESLEDPRYYANIEPTEQAQIQYSEVAEQFNDRTARSYSVNRNITKTLPKKNQTSSNK